MEQNSEPSNKPKISLMWWLILMGLLAWNVWLFWPKSQPEADITYSRFLSEVNAGNVSKVSIQGDQITGSFNKAIEWSPTSVNASATPLATAGTATAAGTQTYSSFKTTFPESVGDPTLLPLLEANGVEITAISQATPLLVTILSGGLPFILLLVVLFWMGRQATQGQSGVLGFGRSKPRLYGGQHTGVTFEDVAGADEAKQELHEVVDFLREPDKYHSLGAHVPHGVLLVGPPGTGKTLLARAIAGEAHVPFYSISASEFVEMFVGVGASRVRDLFEQAKATSPAIVYIDELDAVGRRRGAGLGAVNDEREQTLNQLLVEMDGFDEHQETIVLASTNRPDVLDPALLRPGRFDRQITVNLPDRKGREGILRIHVKGLRLSGDVDLDLLARTTTGFSGADLANLCNEAALIAARNNHHLVEMADFDEALDRIVLGAARALIIGDSERKIIAYHESGHALVAWLTPNADPVQKVTIIPHGMALGVTEQLPGEDRYNYSKEYLLARLSVMLGGRVAEEVALKDITTGAENDLIEATRLARKMVTRWGMGSLGQMALATNDEQPFLGYEISQGKEYSEEMAAKIDRDVQDLLQERYQYVHQLLGRSRDKLDALVQVLLKEDTIDQKEITGILGPRLFDSDGQPAGEKEPIPAG